VTTRLRRLPRRWAVVGGLTLAVAFVGWDATVSEYDRNVAVRTARELAAPIDELCRENPGARRVIGDVDCDRAADVQRTLDGSQPAVASLDLDGCALVVRGWDGDVRLPLPGC
jgi:hypothetical protein